jgi:AcrR family transcriptional regulator
MRQGPSGRILAAALGLFARRGFHGTSIRDIAGEVGLQSASLYGHFPSKEHLLAELVLAGHEEHNLQLRAAMAAAPDRPAEQLVAWVTAHVLTHAHYPVLTMVSNNELHAVPPDLAGAAIAFRHDSELLVVETVQRGTELGQFDPPHPWMAAAAIGGMGIRVANWYEPGLGLTPDEVAASYADMALLMVRSKRKPRRAVNAPPIGTEELLARRGMART